MFFKVVSLAERVSRRLLGPVKPEPARPRGAGACSAPWSRRGTRETDSIFSTTRARRAGHGARARARLASGGPRSIPHRPSRAAKRSALQGRREKGPPVEKIKILLRYIVYVLTPGCALTIGGGVYSRGVRYHPCFRVCIHTLARVPSPGLHVYI